MYYGQDASGNDVYDYTGYVGSVNSFLSLTVCSPIYGACKVLSISGTYNDGGNIKSITDGTGKVTGLVFNPASGSVSGAVQGSITDVCVTVRVAY